MAQNSLFPGFVIVKYSVAGRPHEQTIPVEPAETYDPGEDPNNVQFLLWGGVSTVDFPGAMDTYDDILDDGLSTADASITMAEFYQMDSPTSSPTWICAYEIGHAGASASATVPYSQRTTSFRTSNGSYWKHVVLDQVSATNVEDVFPFLAATPQLALWNYTQTSAGQWIRGRDGGRVVSGLNSVTKTNDALRKKYLLNS